MDDESSTWLAIAVILVDAAIGGFISMFLALTTLTRACGKSNVHHLEPEDLVALTIEAAIMAKLPLATTDWIPRGKLYA